MTSKELREKYLKFFENKEHKIIPPGPLVPEDDSTTLFTTAGMQQLIPYLKGKVHLEGKRLTNSQPCFRSQDIEEVGDTCHTTFFEMLGNWSLGDYFKKDQLTWIWQFLTEELKLDPEKIYVTFFAGNDQISRDTESEEIWKSLGLLENHILPYGVEKNWWSRSGPPDKMPTGEIGGPNSEIFYEFTQVDHDEKFGEKCHPNCECGRFLEIGNSVFIQYEKQENNSFKELPQKNVDFGGGLERLTAVTLNNPDVFQTDLYESILAPIGLSMDKKYEENKVAFRIIADHLRASVFLVADGVEPSNKERGYVLRRLLRRAATKAFLMNREKSDSKFFRSLVKSVMEVYSVYFKGTSSEDIEEKISLEIRKFRATLERGLQQLDKSIQDKENLGLAVFNLSQSYGYPLELTVELLKEREIQFTDFDMNQFKEARKSHIKLSQTASAGMFKGGLGEQSEITTKYHTTTHLLHAALRQILGKSVQQKGSNITSERLRFDFSYNEKLSTEQIKEIEDLVNKAIQDNLSVTSEIMDKQKALSSGALGFFTEKYGDKVTVYTIRHPALDAGSIFSKEICGGPHVKNTGELGKFKIIKEESAGSNLRRIYATLS